MAQIVWTRQAYIERVSILSYGKDVFGEKAMRRLNDEIEKNIFYLQENPQIGSFEALLEENPLGYRSWVIHKNYKLIYFVKDETVFIADIWDTRMEPRKLKQRIK